VYRLVREVEQGDFDDLANSTGSKCQSLFPGKKRQDKLEATVVAVIQDAETTNHSRSRRGFDRRL
jgi:hypothetical protein